MMQRRAHDPTERGLILMNNARETLRTRARDQPLDLASMTNGSTFFRRNAMPRMMMTVTATIEHASSGHMKSPPVEKKVQTDFAMSGICARIR
jgi:hypothetical protein